MKQENLIEKSPDLLEYACEEPEIELLASFPSFQEMTRPLLDILAEYPVRARKIAELTCHIADHLGLTDQQRKLLLPSKTKRVLDYRVQWARSDLIAAGLADPVARGELQITCHGVSFQSNYALRGPLTRQILKQRFSGFSEYLKGTQTMPKTKDSMMGRLSYAILSRMYEHSFPYGANPPIGWLRKDLIHAGICAAQSHDFKLTVKNPQYAASCCLTVLREAGFIAVQKCEEPPFRQHSTCMLTESGRNLLSNGNDADATVSVLSNLWNKYRNRNKKESTPEKPKKEMTLQEVAAAAAHLDIGVLLQHFVPSLSSESRQILLAKLLQGVTNG